MPPFVTAGEVNAWLGHESDRAEEAVEVVTAFIRAYCRQTLTLVQDDTLVLTGTTERRLVVGERPLLAVSAVVIDGQAVEEYRWTRSGTLWRDAGWGGPGREVGVTCDHGFLVVPEPIRSVCLTAASRLVNNPDEAARVQIADQFGETLASPSGFTVTELMVLNRYRRRVWS